MNDDTGVAKNTKKGKPMEPEPATEQPKEAKAKPELSLGKVAKPKAPKVPKPALAADKESKATPPKALQPTIPSSTVPKPKSAK
eukprot:2149260-Alexandrium_andersonii.AAC.1